MIFTSRNGMRLNGIDILRKNIDFMMKKYGNFGRVMI